MDCPQEASGRVTTTRSSHEVRTLVRTDEGQFLEAKAGEVDARLRTGLANDARQERSEPVSPHRVRTGALVLTTLVVFAIGQALVEIETRIIAKTAVINFGAQGRNRASRTPIHVVAAGSLFVTSCNTRAACSTNRTTRSAGSCSRAG